MQRKALWGTRALSVPPTIAPSSMRNVLAVSPSQPAKVRPSNSASALGRRSPQKRPGLRGWLARRARLQHLLHGGGDGAGLAPHKLLGDGHGRLGGFFLRASPGSDTRRPAPESWTRGCGRAPPGRVSSRRRGGQFAMPLRTWPGGGWAEGPFAVPGGYSPARPAT